MGLLIVVACLPVPFALGCAASVVTSRHLRVPVIVGTPFLLWLAAVGTASWIDGSTAISTAIVVALCALAMWLGFLAGALFELLREGRRTSRSPVN